MGLGRFHQRRLDAAIFPIIVLNCSRTTGYSIHTWTVYRLSARQCPLAFDESCIEQSDSNARKVAHRDVAVNVQAKIAQTHTTGFLVFDGIACSERPLRVSL